MRAQTTRPTAKPQPREDSSEDSQDGRKEDFEELEIQHQRFNRLGFIAAAVPLNKKHKRFRARKSASTNQIITPPNFPDKTEVAERPKSPEMLQTTSNPQSLIGKQHSSQKEPIENVRHCDLERNF
jgi:hypothetical protein